MYGICEESVSKKIQMFILFTAPAEQLQILPSLPDGQ